MMLILPILLTLTKLLHPTGSFGGVLEACCLQPMDTIKTRLQLDKVNKYKGASVSCSSVAIP